MFVLYDAARHMMFTKNFQQENAMKEATWKNLPINYFNALLAAAIRIYNQLDAGTKRM